MAQENYALHMHGKWALQHSKTLAKSLLSSGMMKGSEETQVDETVHALSSREVYFDHGSVIDHREAIKLGLKIEFLPPDDELWRRLWLLYCMYDYDCRKSGYLKVFEGSAISTAVALPVTS